MLTKKQREEILKYVSEKAKEWLHKLDKSHADRKLKFRAVLRKCNLLAITKTEEMIAASSKEPAPRTTRVCWNCNKKYIGDNAMSCIFCVTDSQEKAKQQERARIENKYTQILKTREDVIKNSTLDDLEKSARLAEWWIMSVFMNSLLGRKQWRENNEPR